MDSTHPRSDPESAPDGDRNPLDVLAETFLARLRRGEYPAINEYTAQYPELAEEIRTVFPTLALLEQGGDGFAQQAPPKRSKSVPTQIGEYQILREVGRGGMGVVYEAEHDTMRRRVALKVLPARAAIDDVQLQRFYLEARVAGRLHHTNIVPVFEVGTDGISHYYAMQFIRGQSLDVVFDELRRVARSLSSVYGFGSTTQTRSRARPSRKPCQRHFRAANCSGIAIERCILRVRRRRHRRFQGRRRTSRTCKTVGRVIECIENAERVPRLRNGNRGTT